MLNRLTAVLCGALLFASCKSAPETAPSALPDAKVANQALTATPTAAPPAAGPKRIYDEQVTQIDARVGESFEIALPGNVTTPFRWALDTESLSALAKLKAQTYTDSPPPECPRCVGYPGTAHFEIEATQAGEAKVRLAYRRLGQTSGEAKRELTVKLVVSP